MKINGASKTPGPEQTISPDIWSELSDKIGQLGLSGAAGLEQQLETMDVFWESLGYHVPILSDEQMEAAEEAVETCPHRRLVPTPLVDIEDFSNITQRARSFESQRLNPNINPPLLIPSENVMYGKLIREPESTARYEDRDFGLFYKTPQGKLADRDDYISSLQESGQAIAENGIHWVFPVMDIRTGLRRPSTESAAYWHKRTSHVVTAESLITKQLLHQAAGRAEPTRSIDLANGSIYQVNGEGQPKRVCYVPGVSWMIKPGRIGLYYSYRDERDAAYRTPRAESGLNL